ncbi:MAG: hypothetical protein IJB49_09110, partial [Clostridia bacterium]|nr:hypothetical protein [Clostridia bacterium]
MKKICSLILAAIMITTALPVFNVLAVKENFLINSVSITGIDIPVEGDSPDMSVISEEPTLYDAVNVFWYEYDSDWEWTSDLDSNSKFRAGYYYVVYIKLRAFSNKNFQSSTTATINGKAANKTTPEPKDMTIYTSFMCPEAVSNIDLTVVKPAEGKTPTFAKVNTAQYESKNSEPKLSNQSNGVVWTNEKTGVNLSSSNAFKRDGVYSVTYTLYAKDGYAFPKNVKASVNGSAATIVGNESLIYVTLSGLVPAITGEDITSVDLSVVKPIIGKTPTFAKVNTDKYESKNSEPKLSNQSNGVVWTNEKTGINLTVSNPFKADGVYTVSYTLYAKSGYKFADKVNATINGQKATVSGSGMIITVTLKGLVPANDPNSITSVDLTVVKPVIGKTPTFAKVNTDKYESKNSEPKLSNQSNGVVWTNEKTGVNISVSNPFKADGVYTVSYTLYAKDGYKFANNVTATINGQKATVSGGGSIITVTLSGLVPASNKTQLSSINISVPAPEDGNKPSFDKIDGTGYYSDNSGNPVAIYKNGIAWYKNAYSYIGAGT